MTDDYLADSARALFAQHGLDRFDALWALELDSVDTPNTGRGGWSSVSRLELADADGRSQAFYLKRQIDHLSRSLRHPLGEATFAREFRNIRRYQHDDVPALEAVFFGQRRIAGKVCALLVTRALDDHRPLDRWLADWPTLPRATRRAIVDAVAGLARTLHGAGHLHNCLYPKHVFVRVDGPLASARLIDLEKTRRIVLGTRDRARDLDALNRHTRGPAATERLRFLLRYLGRDALDDDAARLVARILRRHHRKAARR
ncbi:lipopolysaccharide kinase InaA family protein [Aromatoleum evansii]|uniref:Lipopolysaccharide kinase InaA family protein n=1 Tax=Aromatoleum evansii TaxID=59406 RepID=A0ABZ1AMK3_AROEV|nr:lipopolysaccharide kinase [Aromatoleum evansii]WRL46988.1 lipopolysaccharide kinase InaA family protein [Aromatoleum evansii]